MPSLYERIARTADGRRRLANSRLRREVLDVLHRALRNSGLSQTDLAVRLGVRKSAVNQVLNGDGNVRIGTLANYLLAADHELKLELVPAGQPRAEVLARRERHKHTVARRAYAAASVENAVFLVERGANYVRLKHPRVLEIDENLMESMLAEVSVPNWWDPAGAKPLQFRSHQATGS